MKLINADKKVTVQMYDDYNEEWYMSTMTIREYLDRYTEEGCPPAVEVAESDPCSDCQEFDCYGCGLKRQEE